MISEHLALCCYHCVCLCGGQRLSKLSEKLIGVPNQSSFTHVYFIFDGTFHIQQNNNGKLYSDGVYYIFSQYISHDFGCHVGFKFRLFRGNLAENMIILQMLHS